MHVVVHRHPRIPLGDLVEAPVAPHPVGAVLGDVELVGQVEYRRRARGERGDELDVHHGVVDPELERLRRERPRRRLGLGAQRSPAPSRHGRTRGERALGEARDVEAARESGAAEPALRGEQERTHAARPEQVLVELHPHEAEGIRRVVRVSDLLSGREPLRGGVERRLDGVVDALFPIAGTRGAVGAADAVRRRQRDRAEDPGVGHGGLQRGLKVEWSDGLSRGVRIRLLGGEGAGRQREEEHEGSHGAPAGHSFGSVTPVWR